MTKKQSIFISIGVTLTLVSILIFVNNDITDQNLEKQKKLDAERVQETKQILVIRDKVEPEFLPYSIVARLKSSNLIKRLVDGAKVYGFEQQDILDNNLQDYYGQNGVSCNTTKCLIVVARGDAFQVDQRVTYLSSFAISGKDYWVSVWFENDQYSIKLSKAGFVDAKELKFEKKIKKIVESGTEKGEFQIQYFDGSKEIINLKTKV
jgi:hypothetical protein